MKYLKEFINKYPDYTLLDTIEYNSYGVKGKRDTFRERESISVSEILNLISDNNMELVKRFHGDSLKEACVYGTNIHNNLEKYVLGTKQLDIKQPIHKIFRLALLKEDIEPKIAEQEFKTSIDGLPPITATVDLQANIKGVMGVIDYKTSRTGRSFISVRNKIQIVAYMWFSKRDIGGLLYLNQKGYTLKMLTEEEIIYYTNIWLDLLKYTQKLFKENKSINLLNK